MQSNNDSSDEIEDDNILEAQKHSQVDEWGAEEGNILIHTEIRFKRKTLKNGVLSMACILLGLYFVFILPIAPNISGWKGIKQTVTVNSSSAEIQR